MKTESGIILREMEIIRVRCSGHAGNATRNFADVTIIDEAGALPQGDAALAAINALLPDGAKSLSMEDVYLHSVEAVNNSYLPDRFAFVDSSTIANVATDAKAGFAFMNMHRTGGFLTEGELPYGRTFAGQYQQGFDAAGKIVERAVVSFYMLRNHEPNGASGINTDQMERGINGGTVFDVSIGFGPSPNGQIICNVCGQDYSSCSHYRGSNENMTLDEQIYARDVLGVPDGVATVSIVDWRCGEISAVYNGACAGAGF